MRVVYKTVYSGTHSDANEVSSLLGCDAVSTGYGRFEARRTHRQGQADKTSVGHLPVDTA